MGLCSESKNEIFNYYKYIFNKSELSLVNINLKDEIEENEKNNYIFLCNIIEYYQSLNNISYINKKYSYYKISSKTKIISSFYSLEKAKELFIYWSQLFYNNPKNKNFSLDKNTIEVKYIKNEIKKNLRKNILLNIFIDNFNYYYDNLDNKEFIKLILSGIPDFLRPIIWNITLEKKHKTIKRQSLNEWVNKEQNNNYFKQISKDINRTFIINNEDNSSIINDNIDEDKINKLKNILIAISNYNSEIGYTQGMNNIIGFLLRVTKFNEEKAFDLAVLIMEEIKGYFTKDFPLLQSNLTTFNNEFIKRNQKLYKHFKNYEILDELWISKWMQTLFTISLPYNELCCIWDSLIIFGFDFIIYLSLAIIDIYEDELLKINDSSDIINHLGEIMNPNTNVKISIDFYPNYKDYIMPIYNIISTAKKIKKKINSEMLFLNSFNGNQYINSFYGNELNINNNHSSNIIYNNYLSNMKFSTKKNIPSIKNQILSLKSPINLSKKKNISPSLNKTKHNNTIKEKKLKESKIDANNNKIKENLTFSNIKNVKIIKLNNNKYFKRDFNSLNNKNPIYWNYGNNNKFNQNNNNKNECFKNITRSNIKNKFINRNNHLFNHLNIFYTPKNRPNYHLPMYFVNLQNLNNLSRDRKKGYINNNLYSNNNNYNNYINTLKKNISFNISQ